MPAWKTWPRKALACLAAGVLACAAYAQQDDIAMADAGSKQPLADLLLEWMQVRYPGAASEGCVLYVSARSQRMYYIRDGEMEREFVISTARNGLGEAANSNRTPQGLHRIVGKIGAGVPDHGILRGRKYTGEIADKDMAQGDVITSRILLLEGSEPGFNLGGASDSMQRSIYIHGTADERSLGSPASHGCIRMRNKDIIALFDVLPMGTLVVILDN